MYIHLEWQLIVERYMVEHTSRLPDMGYYMLDSSSAVVLWETHRCSSATRDVALGIAREYAKEFNVRDVNYHSKLR